MLGALQLVQKAEWHIHLDPRFGFSTSLLARDLLQQMLVVEDFGVYKANCHRGEGIRYTWHEVHMAPGWPDAFKCIFGRTACMSVAQVDLLHKEVLLQVCADLWLPYMWEHC